MGMPCEVNSILKLKPNQGYPQELKIELEYKAIKNGYRIIPVDVPIPLVDKNWISSADINIHKLTWEQKQTVLEFKIVKIHPVPLILKDDSEKKNS